MLTLCRYPVQPTQHSTSMQCEWDTYSGDGIPERVRRCMRITPAHFYGSKAADDLPTGIARIWSFRLWAAVSGLGAQRLASLTASSGVATSLARAAILTNLYSFVSGFRQFLLLVVD